MKNSLKCFLIIYLMFSFTFVVSADFYNKMVYSDAVIDASEYMLNNSFLSTHERYIYTVDDTFDFYSHNGDSPSTNHKFKYGGLLGKWEFDITKKGNKNSFSYLYNSVDFWTYSNSGNKKFVVSSSDMFVEHENNNVLFNTRVTEYTVANASVTGSGTYFDPWIFAPKYKVVLKVNDSNKGAISLNENNSFNDNLSFVIGSDEVEHFFIKPAAGYEYLGNTCGIVANDVDVRNNNSKRITISNVARDIECTINFGEKSYLVKLYEPGDGNDIYSGSQTPVPNVIYVLRDKGWFIDSNSTTRISKLEKGSNFSGYNYHGYYSQKNVSNNKFTDKCSGIQIIDVNNNLASASLRVDGSISSNKESIYSDNMTIYPCFTPIRYKINYDCNGGSSSSIIKATNHVYNELSKLAKNTCKKTGYSFAGWNKEKDGSGDNYLENTSYSGITSSPEITLYAKWVANPYTIKYALDDGKKGTYAPSEGVYDTPLRISNASKVGYTFTGWTVTNNLDTTNARYGSSKDNITTKLSSKSTKVKSVWFLNLSSTSKEVTMTANFNANKYKIEYAPQNDWKLGSNKPAEGVYDKSIQISNPTKTGYNFSGWKIVSGLDTSTALHGSSSSKVTNSISSSDKLIKNQYFKNLTPINDAIVKFEPTWESTKYKIKYSLTTNGKKGTYAPSEGVYDTPLRISNASKVGYTFTGWTVTNNLDTTNARYGSSKDNITTKLSSKSTKVKSVWFLNLSSTSKEVTMTANFSVHSYTLKYDNEEVGYTLGKNTPKIANYDAKVTIPNPTRTGYVFKGWIFSSGLDTSTALYGSDSSQKTSIIDVSKPVNSKYFRNLSPVDDAVIELKATWEPITYNVKFNNNKGKGSVASITCTYDEECQLPEITFTYTDHTLVGLTKKAKTPISGNPTVDYKLGAKVKNLSSKQNDTITLYAAWSIDYYCEDSGHTIKKDSSKGWICVFAATRDVDEEWDDCATGGGLSSSNISCGSYCAYAGGGCNDCWTWNGTSYCTCHKRNDCVGGYVENVSYNCPSGSSHYSGSDSNKKCYVKAKAE